MPFNILVKMTNFSEIWIKIWYFVNEKDLFENVFAKLRPFPSGLTVKSDRFTEVSLHYIHFGCTCPYPWRCVSRFRRRNRWEQERKKSKGQIQVPQRPTGHRPYLQRKGNSHISWALDMDKCTQRAHDAIITSLWRQNDVATSFWRPNNVNIASFVCWVVMSFVFCGI